MHPSGNVLRVGLAAAILALSATVAVVPAAAQTLNAGCPATITWTVGDSDTIETVNILFIGGAGDTVATLATGTANDGSDSLTVPCVAAGEYMGTIRVLGDTLTISDQPATLVAAAPSILELMGQAGAVGDTCRSIVTFNALVVDDCGLDPDAVTVELEIVDENAMMEDPMVEKMVMGDSILVSGSVGVSALTGPAVLRVRITAVDGCELAGVDSLDLDVVDDIKPVVMCPMDITVECSEFGGTPATHPDIVAFLEGVTATDNCDPEPMITNDAPELFPLGETMVTFTATDGSGNDSTCFAVVTVQDTTPPNLIVNFNRTFLWPPNHKMHVIEADVQVEDDCDPNATFKLISVESSEPDDGRGDGHTTGDIQGVEAGTDDASFALRAERSGPGNGRVYSVIYEASDTSENTALDTAYVIVPHDRGGRAHASNGFAADGGSLQTPDGRFALIIPSFTDGGRSVDAMTLQLFRVQLSNKNGAAAPLEVYAGDVNGDLRTDAVIVFGREAIDALRLDSPSGRNDVSLFYNDRTADHWTVGNVFALGSPIAVDFDDLERIEQGGPRNSDEGDSGDPVQKPGAISIPLSKRLLVAPNPFRPQTVVRYRVPVEGHVRMDVYDVTGRPVLNLVDRVLSVGDHSITWDGRNRAGQRLTPGVYMVHIQGGGPAETSKIVMLE